MNRCILCGKRIGPTGWVHLTLTTPNSEAPYKSGYVCRGCQKKYRIGPEHVLIEFKRRRT